MKAPHVIEDDFELLVFLPPRPETFSLKSHFKNYVLLDNFIYWYNVFRSYSPWLYPPSPPGPHTSFSPLRVILLVFFKKEISLSAINIACMFIGVGHPPMSHSYGPYAKQNGLSFPRQSPVISPWLDVRSHKALSHTSWNYWLAWLLAGTGKTAPATLSLWVYRRCCIQIMLLLMWSSLTLSLTICLSPSAKSPEPWRGFS